MIYGKFTIEYFRSFETEQELVFAIPDGGKGSGITYIVGNNNSGKTTLIESMCRGEGDSIRSSEEKDQPPIFRLYDVEGKIKKEVTVVRPGSCTLKENVKVIDDDKFEIVSARRHRGSSINKGMQIPPEQVGRSTLGKGERNVGWNFYIGEALRTIELDRKKYDDFIYFVQQVIPEFSSFSVGNEHGGEFIRYKTRSGATHTSEFLGDGIISLLRILLQLYANNKEQPLVIDEPELSLHPLSQKRLLKVIGDCAQQRQIIISTHSPYFISWEYIQNGGKLNKVSKHEDRYSEIHTLKPYETYIKLINGGNWKQPFLMDIVAKEIFFYDNVLFVEGQEDVGLLKKYGDIEDKVNMFGYGVRGKDTFKFALQLAKDLGIQRAAAILDGGKSEETIKLELEEQYPEYKIIQRNREDIRDKGSYEEKEKIGYFNEKGEKKKESELDDYETKIAEINSYF